MCCLSGLAGKACHKRWPSPCAYGRLRSGLLWVTVALLMFGLVMVYSASIAMPDNPKFARYAHTHFLMRHVLSLVVAFIVAVLAFQVPLATWEKLAPWLFVMSLLLLILVLVPFIGKGVNGARRWISLGIMNFQPSELAKFAVLLYAADYMVRKMEVKERFFRAVMPMAIAIAIVGLLLLAEPDMGAFMVISVIAMGILFPGRRQCPHVFCDRHRGGRRVRVDGDAERMAARADFCLPRSLERQVLHGQGLSVVALADCFRAR
jgi:cell division protein FtsW (lipid II flippase)